MRYEQNGGGEGIGASTGRTYLITVAISRKQLDERRLDPVGGGGPNGAYRSNFQGSTGERVEAGRHAADHEWIRDTLRLRHASSRTPLPLVSRLQRSRRLRWVQPSANASIAPVTVLPRKDFHSFSPPGFPPFYTPVPTIYRIVLV